MCGSLFLIAARLFLLYCFAMWHFIIYFTLMQVITGQSTSWSVIDKYDILRDVSKAFVDTFELKTFCLPTHRTSPGNCFRVGENVWISTSIWSVICLKTKVPENYAEDCINLKDYQPIILLAIVDIRINFVTFVISPEKSQDAIFFKNPSLSRMIFIWLKSYSINK